MLKCTKGNMCDVRLANAASSTYKQPVHDIKAKYGTRGLHHKAAKRTEH